MIDLKPEIQLTLRGNAELVALLDGLKTYPETAPDGVVEPYITFFEITNFDDRHADDVPISSEIHFHIDIFTKGNTAPIAKQVDKSMKSIGFGRSGSAEQYDKSKKMYQKILRYKTNRESE